MRRGQDCVRCTSINEEGLVVYSAVQEGNREKSLFSAKTGRMIGVSESNAKRNGVDGFDVDEDGPIWCDTDVGAGVSHWRIPIDTELCRMSGRR